MIGCKTCFDSVWVNLYQKFVSNDQFNFEQHNLQFFKVIAKKNNLLQKKQVIAKKRGAGAPTPPP